MQLGAAAATRSPVLCDGWAVLAAHLLCAGHQRLELAVGAVAREVLHSAIRGGDELVLALVRKGPPDSLGDRLRRLHPLVAEVEDAEDDGLVGRGSRPSRARVD